MEAADHGSLEAMARLTWWNFDPEHKVYQNVISKRQIPEAQWKPHYDTFVHLTKDKGQSPTQTFLHVSPALPNVNALAGQMEAMNLGQSSQSPPSTADATKSEHGLIVTSRSKSASPPPSKKSTKAAVKAAVTPSSGGSKTPATASSSTPPKAKQVVIGNEAFQASYRQSTGKWVVTYKGEELDIVRVGRDSVIVRRDGTQIKVSEAK
ncbi:hypothetical protein NEMBOFW57_001205 [Staphylotrichum longicolle]|uniref:Uncharacterized protein n=1 Tax=Staphylotrichum longicolle TaxID=669026 RepID=A0AAD4F0R2_9PEZI|nr:hypothetical protein NEMBOFW57_001205 [Staphylotrichum longicolle]